MDEIRNKVVLVGLNSPVLRKEENADEESMAELAALVETAGGETLGTVLQNRNSPDPRCFIGEGKAAEVQLFCENTGADMVIFDNDLSPSQQRVLTEMLGVQVLDRCGLILDIFAQRAKTKEGRLQVELAEPGLEISLKQNRLEVQFSPENTPAARLIGEISEKYGILDMTLERTPIDRVVADMYAELAGGGEA